MPYILNIDTAIDSASVCLAKDEQVTGIAINENRKDHAAWLQPAIKNVFASANIALKELDAVAVSIGPGSYTGLRIGLSAAKGLCYALNIPLIAISTLEMMAAAAVKIKTADLYCPMIDARRMEVFTAVYKRTGEQLVEPRAIIVDKDLFADLLKNNSILFFGNGSPKVKHLIDNQNAIYETIKPDASELINISSKRFQVRNFDSVAYTEPAYIKQFYSNIK